MSATSESEVDGVRGRKVVVRSGTGVLLIVPATCSRDISRLGWFGVSAIGVFVSPRAIEASERFFARDRSDRRSRGASRLLISIFQPSS